jgi:hypothetical protein
MNCFSMKASVGKSIRVMCLSLTAATLLFAVTDTNAVCSAPARSSTGVAAKLPFLPAVALETAQGTGSPSIVGLWHVTYTADFGLFYEAYDQWHSDKTELENADVSPIEGNICMGAWKKVGPRTVQLNHVGWGFDATGNPNGTFTIHETNTVSSDGMSYRGTFEYKFFLPDGTLDTDITGTLAATRITAD